MAEKIKPENIQLDLAVTRAPKRIQGRLPINVPVTAMGITKEGAATLTGAAKKLTKADLILLQSDPTAAKTLGLSAKDLNSIRSAFARPIDVGLGKGGAAGLSVSCCCCTPCCCAAAALEPQRPVA
jgi:hypothetical protein